MDGITVRTTFDADADAVYIGAATEAVQAVFSANHVCEHGVEGGAIVLDLDSEGRVLGIEFLGASRILSGAFLHEFVASSGGSPGAEGADDD